MRWSMLLAGLALAAGVAQAAEASVTVVRLETRDAALIRTMGARFGHLVVSREKGIVLFEADATELAALRASGLAVSIDKEATARLRDSTQFFLRAKAGIPGYACYRTVTETNARLTQLATQYPGLVTVQDIGDSWERSAGLGGEDMRVLRVTNSAVPGPKPVMFMMTAVHAREYATAEVGLRFVEWLIANHGVDADATWMLDTQEIHLLVQSNPDGRKQAEGGAMWRKNTNRTACSPTSSNRGIDLNRNFPFKWAGAQDGNGSSPSPCMETYRGPLPQSEPEVSSIVAYLRTIFPDRRGNAITDAAPNDTQGLFLDIHSYSQLVLWPWGWTNTGAAGVAPNAATLETLGRRFAWYNDYTPEQANELYSTDGTTDDNAYGELGVPAYTFELGTAFFESCASFESDTNPKNFAALLYGARILQAPYRWPSGPEARTVTVDPDLVLPFETAVVMATIDDSGFNQTNGGAQAVHNVAGASAYLSTAPWQAGATPWVMTSDDGAFNEPNETVVKVVAAGALPLGKHLVYVQGRDASGADGPPAAAFFEVMAPTEVAHASGMVTSIVDGSAIMQGTVRIGSHVANTGTTGGYSRRVRVGTYDFSVSAPGYETYVANDVTYVTGMNIRSPAMYPLCTLLEETAENGTNGWTTQVTSGGNTWGIVNPNAVTTTRAWTESPAGNYGNNIDTSLLSPARNLAGYTEPVLSFDSYCDTEAGFDYGIVEVSPSPGVWTEVHRCDGEPSWQRVSIAVPALAGAAQARVRFRLDSDTGFTDDGWYVDNIRLQAGGPSCRAQFSLDAMLVDGFE